MSFCARSAPGNHVQPSAVGSTPVASVETQGAARADFDRLLTAREAAAHVHLTPSGFYRRLRRRGIHARQGERLRFTTTALDRLFGVPADATVHSFYEAGLKVARRA